MCIVNCNPNKTLTLKYIYSNIYQYRNKIPKSRFLLEISVSFKLKSNSFQSWSIDVMKV